MTTDRWRKYQISPDATHHILEGSPAYDSRFTEVLKFHEPGLAPVIDESGGYHINPLGSAIYPERYLRTFGFYEGLAAVQGQKGWLHVLPDGRPLYGTQFAWCGNFQEGRCPVRTSDGSYHHITSEGKSAYKERYRYAGDFRDSFAVVQRDDGKHTHIDRHGEQLHSRWFLNLDVFHKGIARACDSRGWHHVDGSGEPLYEARFKDVEPFYNGQARVERFDQSLAVIGESGQAIVELRTASRSLLEEVSSDMVGLWRTQTIRAAVELGVFERLPATAGDLERNLGLGQSIGPRLMRALAELGLTRRDGSGRYHATEKGTYLLRSHPLSLADAALHWGGETYAAWAEAVSALRTGESSWEKLFHKNVFDLLQEKPDQLVAYHSALAAYASHDYQGLSETFDFGVHERILDAGGGAGELLFALLRSCPKLTGTIMDRPKVIDGLAASADVADRCKFVEGDLFQKWPVESEAVVLARVLHDWPDHDALRILHRARNAMPPGGALYVVEMVLDESSASGGLLDLNMLVITRGAERTVRQFRSLLHRAGFEMLDVRPTGSVSSIIRAEAA